MGCSHTYLHLCISVSAFMHLHIWPPLASFGAPPPTEIWLLPAVDLKWFQGYAMRRGNGIDLAWLLHCCYEAIWPDILYMTALKIGNIKNQIGYMFFFYSKNMFWTLNSVTPRFCKISIDVIPNVFKVIKLEINIFSVPKAIVPLKPPSQVITKWQHVYGEIEDDLFS